MFCRVDHPAPPLTLNHAAHHRARTPGAIDQLLDEVYSTDMPEPEWAGLDMDREEEAEEAEDSGGEEEEQQITTSRGGIGGIGGSGGAAADSSSSSSPPPSGRLAARHRHPHHPHHPRPKGVVSLFTWAGNGCCLGPLGSLLPELRTLHVALPPSLCGLMMQETAGAAVEHLPEAAISFTHLLVDLIAAREQQQAAARDAARGSDRLSAEQQQQQQQQQPDPSTAAANSSSVPTRIASTPSGSSFLSLRHLSIENLTSPYSQWDPSARLGDLVLSAVAGGCPSLETLQLDGVLCFTGAGLRGLGALPRLKALALHHWMSESPTMLWC